MDGTYDLESDDASFAFLQILTRRIIFDADGEMVDYVLISTFVHLRSILQDLSAPGSGDGSSEHVRSGVFFMSNHIFYDRD